MMEKEFIPYEQALKLKELGFDEKCLMAFYGSSREDKKDELFLHNGFGRIRNSNLINEPGVIAAPLWQQAFDWFREKYNIVGLVESFDKKGNQFKYSISNHNLEKNVFSSTSDYHTDCLGNKIYFFYTYEEARLECLKKLIEIIR